MYKIKYLFLFIVLISCENQSLTERERRIREKENELIEREKNLTEHSTKIDSTQKSLSELFKLNSESVFLIITKNKEGSAQGSGFFIREDGVGVSNFHVFEDAEEVIIKVKNGDQFMITEILNYDKEKDFVIFKISNSKTNTFKPLILAKINPDIGEECFAIGNPNGLEQTLSKGIISGYRGDYIQTTAQITHGSSGGALFNARGEVIGITTMGFDEADLNFALNIIDFDFFNTNKILEKPKLNTSDNYHDIAVNIIEEYFQALSKNDFEKLETLFADKFTRFYNEFNFTKQEAINDHKEYANKYPNPVCKIHYSSINMNQDLDGSILINLKLDFTIKKDSWHSSRTFVYDMFIKLDSEYKINSVFTSIIDQK